jgi:hypothetical protein
MNKIGKFLKGLKLLAGNPWLMNVILDDQYVNKKDITERYQLPKGLPTLELLDLCPNLNETITPYTYLDGGSTLADLLLLKGLARQYPQCAYFEIGTWRGESVANVASVASNCVTLNLPDATMRAMGLSEDYVRLHRYFSKHLANVTHLQHDSTTFDFSPHNNKYDLVFVDGDHHYDSVKSDTANAYHLLRDENSLIVWHDYGNTPADVRWDVLRGILDGMPATERKHLYRVSNTLCAIYCRRPLKGFYPPEIPEPNKVFEAAITIKKL